MDKLTAAFAQLQNDNRWFTLEPFSDKEIDHIEKENNFTIPSAIRKLLKHAAAGEWSGKKHVQFFDDVAIGDVQPALKPQLDGTFAFASDGGSKWYILDFRNQLGRGADTVWVIYAASPYPEDAQFIAEDLPAFIQWMVSED